LMGRTAKRPIPAGRMTPAQGLAWGLGLSVLSVYVVAGAVNGLAATLVLAGILYYVILYTLILKRTSDQNIVIGGGAGAMAPVVGYVAITGRLDWTALFLFAIIFLWTPPHFWALAIVRLKDYARAGVPMLPVARGEGYTRRQIIVYTVVLLAVTLLMPLVGLAGWIYLAAALLLNLWLLYAAWQVWKLDGNKIAWSLYRTSSMYLAFLFLALMADAVWRLPLW
jgi:heme o synthase